MKNVDKKAQGNGEIVQRHLNNVHSTLNIEHLGAFHRKDRNHKNRDSQNCFMWEYQSQIWYQFNVRQKKLPCVTICAYFDMQVID